MEEVDGKVEKRVPNATSRFAFFGIVSPEPDTEADDDDDDVDDDDDSDVDADVNDNKGDESCVDTTTDDNEDDNEDEERRGGGGGGGRAADDPDTLMEDEDADFDAIYVEVRNTIEVSGESITELSCVASNITVLVEERGRFSLLRRDESASRVVRD